MDKIFKALEKVEKRTKLQNQNQTSPTQKSTPSLSIKAKDNQVIVKQESSDEIMDRQKDLFTIHAPDSFIAEQFRTLRNVLLSDSKYSHIRTILVASALPSEGKTLVAVNLAISLAQMHDKQVLLVDTDMRKPAIHNLFNLTIEGLSDYLSSEKHEGFINETDINNLLVMSSGVCPDDLSELISSEKMKSFIREAKSSYKDCYIIFDSSPVQLFSELITLAKVVDGILLVAKAGETKMKIIDNTINTLGKEKVIGIILNHYKATSNEFSNYQNLYQCYQKAQMKK